MEFNDLSPESERVAVLERQLDAARDAHAGLQQLLVDLGDIRAVLPATRCITWRSEAAANYEIKLDQLVGRTALALFSVEQAEREVAGGIARIEHEVVAAREARQAALTTIAGAA